MYSLNVRKMILIFIMIVISFGIIGCTSQDKYEEKIPELVAKRVEAVINRDINKYLNTVNGDNEQYYNEQKRWIDDIVQNDITDYELEIAKMQSLDESKVVVTLNQKYKYKNKNYDITYDGLYLNTENGWKDSDINFQTKETEKFIFKYIEGDEKLDKLIKSAEKAYDEITERYGKEPEGKTVIKIYNDRELLRQATKLSIEWQFTGWYEMKESLKVFSGRELGYSYQGLFEHELIHRMTMEASNNNMSYWFAEGLATYIANFPQRGGDPIELGWYNKKDFNLRIDELEEINLEKLTESYDVGRYYGVSGMIIKYVDLTYGRDKLLEIINELGTYPSSDNISNEKFYKENNIKLEEVFVKVLGKNKEKISNEWIEWLDNL